MKSFASFIGEGNAMFIRLWIESFRASGNRNLRDYQLFANALVIDLADFKHDKG